MAVLHSYIRKARRQYRHGPPFTRTYIAWCVEHSDALTLVLHADSMTLVTHSDSMELVPHGDAIELVPHADGGCC